MNTAGKIAVGVLAGAAAGAILGVLFAPDKGSETRKKIARRSREIKDDVKEKLSDFIGNVKDKFELKESHDHGQKEKAKADTV